MQGRARWLWIALIPVACVAYQWLAHLLIVQSEAASLRVLLAWLNGVPHAVINLAVLIVFGKTLRPGREPLVTSFARRVHGTLLPHIEAYTRRVTQAWCIFFASQVLVSAILFMSASLSTWSLFINVLSSPSIVLMFVAEYLYRIVRFPDHPHVSIWKGIQTFMSHPRPSPVANARSRNV
jgi:uncharacterized membrane protein